MRQIHFEVFVGGEFRDDYSEPIGGKMYTIVLDMELTEKDPYKQAMDLLDNYMKRYFSGETYLIWQSYWS